MIHLAREDCRIEHRNGIIAIRVLGKSMCPLCGGALGVRGTCRRKVYTMRGTYILQLRVLYCCECGRTHRELPYFLIPYKRYSTNAIMISCSRLTAHSNVKPARDADYGIGGAGFVYVFGSLGNVESDENGR